jgi:hypothetical protein
VDTQLNFEEEEEDDEVKELTCSQLQEWNLFSTFALLFPQINCFRLAETEIEPKVSGLF